MNTDSSLFKDTICAPATPVGGALAVVRLSGPSAITVAQSVFNKDINHAKSQSLHYGSIVDDDTTEVDDVMLSVYRSPHSYTGEDSVEISCHGSSYVVEHTLALLVAHGARMAEPGEFTRRAYLNGKMDLSQAEAVADLIASSTRAQHDIAIRQLKGGISDRLSDLRDQLLRLNSLLELELDFSDHEELEFANRGELLSLACDIDGEVTALARSFGQGNAIKKGIPVAIVGKTNVGKSTLLNCLLGDERAIVSDVHGTTRDTIEDTLIIEGTLFRLIDTAGLRHTDDRVEQIGIDRSLNAISHAAIVLWVVDSNPSDEELHEMEERCKGRAVAIVWNKNDVTEPITVSHSIPQVNISAKSGIGVEAVLQLISNLTGIGKQRHGSVIVSNLRHYNQLNSAHTHLQEVITGITNGQTSDLLAENLKDVLSDLASITGRGIITPQETLNNIFKHFCVGK